MSSSLSFVDLFAGAGGASTGLIAAGLNAVGAVEVDSWAAETYSFNHPSVKVIQADISQLSDADISVFKGVDLIVGGPPCQGFSISASNRRDKNDPRNQLYIEFLRSVKIIRPKFVLVENVKEIIKFKLQNGISLIDDFSFRLKELGYSVSFQLINAKNLGVPQDRVRFFLIGSMGDPIGFRFDNEVSSPNKALDIPVFLTVKDAISDLPEPNCDTYAVPPQNLYQAKLRLGNTQIHNHEPMRHTQRMIERFKHIPIGGNTSSVPMEHRNRQRGDSAKFSSKIYHQNHRRLNPDEPSRTITASFYSSFIHPYENRNLTVREAARIQGFPDSFQFFGKRTTLSKKLLAKKGIFEDIHLDQFNQVGNAVPPIVAEQLGKLILSYYEKI